MSDSEPLLQCLQHCINHDCADCPREKEHIKYMDVCRKGLLRDVMEYIRKMNHGID